MTDTLDEETAELSTTQVSRALRVFLTVPAIWGAYGAVVTLEGPFFTKLVEHSGFPRRYLGLFWTLAAVTGLFQFLAYPVMRRFADRRNFVVLTGLIEVLVTPLVFLVPVFFAGGSKELLLAMFAVTLVGRISVGFVLPSVQSWQSAIIPENIRASFIGRRVFNYMAAMIVSNFVLSYLCSGENPDLDLVLPLFFPIAAVSGVVGYIWLRRAPYRPEPPRERKASSRSAYAEVLRNRPFMLLVLFCVVQTFGMMLARPYFRSFMMTELEIPVSDAGVIENIFIVGHLIGFLLGGKAADRFGHKPLWLLTRIPLVVVPLLWIVAEQMPAAGRFPASALVQFLLGLGSSGAWIGGLALVYKLAPRSERFAVYFAVYSATATIAAAAAPLVGGHLIDVFTVTPLAPFGIVLPGLRSVFLLSSVITFASLIMLAWVPEDRAVKARTVLWNLSKGSLFQYAWGSLRLWAARDDRAAAGALATLGDSRNPMAVEALVGALDHPDRGVRSRAARALGDIGDPSASNALAQRLEDEESDIRPEAAEALGALGAPEGLEPLLRALESPDRRVATSAMLALSGIGEEAAARRLEAMIDEPFERATFPTLVESLARLGVSRVAPSTVAGLAHLRSTAIRLQVLMAAARMLGCAKPYSRLVRVDGLRAAGRIESATAKAKTRMRYAWGIDQRLRRSLLGALNKLQRGVFRDDSRLIVDGAQRAARSVLESAYVGDPGSGDMIGLTARTILAYADAALRSSSPHSTSAAGNPPSLHEAKCFLVTVSARLIALVSSAARGSGAAT